MARMTLHKGDRVAFLDRRDQPRTGELKLVPWGRRTWAVLRDSQKRLHRIPRSRIVAVVEHA